MASLRSIVDVRPGEGRPLGRLALLLGLVIAGHTMLETVRDSLFLTELPFSRLAMVYGLMAALALLAVPAGGRLARRLGRRDALGVSLAVSAVGTTAFALTPPGPAMAIVLYLWTGLVGTIVSAQFWMLAGQTFDMAQGKRLFGPLAAAGALGAFGGAAIAVQVVAYLPLTALIPAAALIQAIAGLIARGGHELRPAAEPIAPRREGTGPTATVRRQMYLRRIALLVALSSAGLLGVDFLFKGTITLHIAPSHLPGFLARFHAVVTAGSFLLQIIGTGWLVRRSGVVVALCVLPALLLGGALTAIVAPLLGVMIARGADGVLRHSLHRVAAELLWAPVPPGVREAVRSSVDSVLMRLAQAATAAALVGLAAVGIDRPPLLAAIVAVVLAAWFAAAVLIRRAYLDQFRLAVARPTFDGRTDAHLDLDAAEVLIEALASPDPRRVTAAIEVLHNHGRARLVPALVLHHPDPQVLLAALTAIAVPARTDWQALTQRLLGHDVAAVRLAAVRALARNGRLDLVRDTSGLRLDPTMRGHTAFWGASQGEVPGDSPAVVALLDEAGASGTAARAALLDAIGTDGDRRWSPVIAAIIARDPGTCAGALAAIERVADPRFIPELIARLGVRRDRTAIRAGLVHLGEVALDALERAFADPHTPGQVRVHLPTTIAQFGGPRPAVILLDHLDERGPAGFRVLRALARLATRRRQALRDPRLVAALRRNLAEHVRIGAMIDIIERGPASSPGELLQALLRDKQGQALERAFMLLQVVFPDEDLHSVHDAFRFGDGNGRAGARELLGDLTRRTRSDRGAPAEVRGLLGLLAADLDEGERRARAFSILSPVSDDVGAVLAELANDDDLAAAELARAHRVRVVAASPDAIELPPAALLISLPPPPRSPEEARRVRRN